MDLNKYQEQAMTTCMESCDNDVYAITGMTAEVGEINDKIAKWTRKGYIVMNEAGCVDFTDKGMDSEIDFPKELAKEVGDVLWFVALMSKRIGIDLEQVAQMNLDKLASRKERGVIDGNGDNR